MSFTVRTQPSGHSFSIETDETVLDAALRQGQTFPFGCRSGVCGACKGRIVSGNIHYPDEDDIPALAQINPKTGEAILCKAVAHSDLVIEVNNIPELAQIKSQRYPVKVKQINRLSDDVMQLFLQLPPDNSLNFLAGQYIDIILNDGSHRSFSLANTPKNDGLLELHIRHIKGGRFTDSVFNDLQKNDILRIEAPLGSFFLREKSDKPLILVAGGTGFAPIKSIIQHLIDADSSRAIHLYWGARDVVGLYQNELAQTWVAQGKIQYTPVLSEQEDAWGGTKGWVHQQVLNDYPDLSPYAVYICGAPAMVKAAKQDFCAHGLPESDFFADAYEFNLK